MFDTLGNAFDMATSYAALGGLRAAKDEPEGAIALHRKALAIRLRLGVPGASRNLAQLSALRMRLGPEWFSAVLDEFVDRQNKANLSTCWTATRAIRG